MARVSESTLGARCTAEPKSVVDARMCSESTASTLGLLRSPSEAARAIVGIRSPELPSAVPAEADTNHGDGPARRRIAPTSLLPRRADAVGYGACVGARMRDFQ
jgi:hypothetical protein